MRLVPAFLARLPTRVRVALAFTLVMAVLLSALGLFLFVRLGASLDATVDRGLRSRAGDLTALIEQADSGLAEAGHSPLTRRGESLAQIVDARGRIVDAAPALRDRPLLRPDEVRRALAGATFFEHPRSPIRDDAVRLFAAPVTAQERRLLVVVGTSLEPSEDARRQLGTLLLIGGPIALLLASLAGYGAAASALRPVEQMRRRARDIQASRPGQRLPVPPSGDEVAHLGETLNEMLRRLEDAFARERRFVADASHELRTPLSILKAELELALRDARDVTAFRSAVASAAEEADRLVQLAEDLLVLARSDQGRLPVRLAAVQAVDLLAMTERRFARRAQERGVALTVTPGEPLRVMADELRVEQALGNLVDNALRHGRGAVVLTAERRGDRVALHVRDDGPGFPHAFLAEAFERFSRADAARATSSGAGGAGLGLAIVEAVARAHGGAVGARNRGDGGGADVWIELLLAGEPAQPPLSGSVTTTPS